jgi:PAS domain S-box-containing protein
VETAKESILVVQEEHVVFVNNGFLRLLDMTPESVLGRNFTEFVAAEDRELLLNNYRLRVSGVENRVAYDIRLLDRHGKTIWVTVSAARITHQGRPASMALLTDISARMEREAERERLIEELRLALQEKKTLSGLLPICAHCKKIRDDQGYWKQIEVYIHSHSAVEFSHGVCPDCLEKWFPDEAEDVRAEQSRSTQS